MTFEILRIIFSFFTRSKVSKFQCQPIATNCLFFMMRQCVIFCIYGMFLSKKFNLQIYSNTYLNLFLSPPYKHDENSSETVCTGSKFQFILYSTYGIQKFHLSISLSNNLKYVIRRLLKMQNLTYNYADLFNKEIRHL